MVPWEWEGERLWWDAGARCSLRSSRGAVAGGCCWWRMLLPGSFRLSVLRGSGDEKPSPQPHVPSLICHLAVLLKCGHPGSGTLRGGCHPLGPGHRFFRTAFPRAVCSHQVCPVAPGRPCHTPPLLLSICSRNGNRCECTRTLQRVAMSGDTVENPSLRIGLVVCWRLRRRRSISSCWHRPAFVHRIWPRWKLNRAQVSVPTYPSTTPSRPLRRRPRLGSWARRHASGAGWWDGTPVPVPSAAAPEGATGLRWEV